MKNILDLLESIEYKKHNVQRNIEIDGIQYDSRKVKSGDVFVAIDGFQTDGHQFIQQAINNGASVVVLTKEEYAKDEFNWVLVDNGRETLADLSNALYDFPSHKLTLIGITGTNGKTTTTNLIAKILEDQGKKVGLIGTIHNRIGQEIIPVSRTTPESSDLQQLFARMVEEGVSHAIMEVSSHALDLARVRGCSFDVAVFTNLTQDHLDYHETMEEYCRAKTLLFRGLDKGVKKDIEKTAVINLDDQWAANFITSTQAQTITYGIEKMATLRGTNLAITAQGVTYEVDGQTVNLQLTGKFNVYNSLAALGTAIALGIDEMDAIKSLEDVSGIAGRFQLVDDGQDFAVIVDYAHTADSLVNVLTTIQEFAQGKIITVFGCGGDRDRTKRPLMGKAAAQYSDFCVVTSDNPRTEKPENILEDILPGVKEAMVEDQYAVEVDRQKAIIKAVSMAQSGDVILIAGKGHEDYQEVNGEKHHFDDYEVALVAIKEKNA